MRLKIGSGLIGQVIRLHRTRAVSLYHHRLECTSWFSSGWHLYIAIRYRCIYCLCLHHFGFSDWAAIQELRWRRTGWHCWATYPWCYKGRRTGQYCRPRYKVYFMMISEIFMCPFSPPCIIMIIQLIESRNCF